MLTKMIASLVLAAAVVAGGGATWRALSPCPKDSAAAQPAGTTCYPGSAECCDDCGTLGCECCYDGSPCCGANCCPDGATCCSTDKGCCGADCCGGTADK
jgi:hypothetical protein